MQLEDGLVWRVPNGFAHMSATLMEMARRLALATQDSWTPYVECRAPRASILSGPGRS